MLLRIDFEKSIGGADWSTSTTLLSERASVERAWSHKRVSGMPMLVFLRPLWNSPYEYCGLGPAWTTALLL